MDRICKEIFHHAKLQHPEAIPTLPHRNLRPTKGGVKWSAECPSCMEAHDYDGISGRHCCIDSSFCNKHVENVLLRPRKVRFPVEKFSM